MKKIGYTVASLLEIILYAGAYVFNYFTRRKMGMSRYVVFLNRKIEEAVPIQSIMYAGAVVTVILLIIEFAIYMKKRENLGKLSKMMNIVSVITTVLYVYHILMNNVGTMRAYYVLSVFYLAAGIIQLVKTIVACLVCGKEKNRK